MTASSQHRRKALACLLACVTMAVALLCLGGCKYSDVLTQHTEDPEIGVLDENADPIYEIDPDAPEMPDLADVSIGDSEDEETQTKVLPHYDPYAPDNGPTPQRTKSTQTPHDDEASEGNDDENPDRKGDGKNSEEGRQGEISTEDGEGETGDNEGSGDELNSDEADANNGAGASGAGDTTVVVNPDGTTTETAKGTIVAVGEYATITQMLGGAGGLVGCDADWLAARKADGAFSGELGRVKKVASGDGTESGSFDVDAVIDTVKPSVVLWDSTENAPKLTQAERDRIEKAGISIEQVPHLGEQTTEDMEVLAAVQTVASVLEGATGIGLDPADVLEQYTSFHNDTLKACYGANDGYSYKITNGQYVQLYQKNPLSGLDNATTTRTATAFIDSIMTPSVSRAEVAQNATTVDGTMRLGHDKQVLDVSDGVGLSATTATGGYMLIDYYLQISGFMNNSYDTDKPEAKGRPYIIMPGSTDAFGKSEKYAARTSASALFYNAGDATVTANWHVLGKSDFPAVLAADDDVAQAIWKSAGKTDGLYHMDDVYRVIVVPSGIGGSWAQGHVDSFLLAPWAFRMNDEANLESAASYASTFYTKFMRCKDWSSAIRDWDNAREAQ